MLEQTEQQAPLDVLRPALADLIKKRVDADLEPERFRQRIRLQKADFYNRGIQHLAPTVDAITGEFGWQPVGRAIPSEDDAEQTGILDYNLDIIQSYRRKYVGVLGLRPFYNVKAMPDDPQSEVDRRTAKQYELATLWLRSVWNVRVRNIEIFDQQWRTGTPYVYLPFVADRDDFGESEEPVVEAKPVVAEPAGFRCPQCGAKFEQPDTEQVSDEMTGAVMERMACPECRGAIAEHNFEEEQTVDVPQVVSTKKYANSGPKFVLTNGFFVTVPYDLKDCDKAPYLLYEYGEQPGELLRIFGDDLRKYMTPEGEFKADQRDTHPNAQDQYAREALYSLAGAQRPKNDTRWTFSRYWLTPSMYEMVQDEQKRTLLFEKYPDGLKVSAVNGAIIRLENEALSDHWVAIPPEAGNAVYHDPVCWQYLPHQDVTNHLINIILAYSERGLPTALIDPDLLDDQILNKPFRPWEVIPAKAGVGSRLQNSVAILPHASFPDQLPPVMGMVEQNVQNGSGLLPNVWGGASTANKTADQFRNELNQALQTLGVPGEIVAQGWVKIFTKAVKLLAKHGVKGSVVPVHDAMGSSSELLDLESLRAGKCHFEAEVGVPMSWAERKAALELIISQNPQLASAMGLDSPMSVHAIRDFLLPNMPEIRTTLDDVRQKVIETIQVLLEQQPIEQPVMGPDGAPTGETQFLPSIQPEPFVDDHGAEAEIVKQWLNSEPGRSARKKNETGWRNVVAFGMAQADLAAPPEPIVPPEGEAPPPPDQKQLPAPAPAAA